MLLAGCRVMQEIEARVKFVSIEPMLEDAWCLSSTLVLAGISLVIIGAQTKPYKPPELDWVKYMVDSAEKAGAKVFLKNNLRKLLPKEPPYLPVCAPVEGRDPCIDCDVKESCHANDRWQSLRQELPV